MGLIPTTLLVYFGALTFAVTVHAMLYRKLKGFWPWQYM